MKGRNKYGAKLTKRKGKTYASRAEARYSDRLRAAQKAGKLAFFLEQVPFRMAGDSIKYVLDFIEFWNTEQADVFDIRFVDVKSPATESKETFRLKIRLIEQEYPHIFIECRDAAGKPIGQRTKEYDAGLRKGI